MNDNETTFLRHIAYDSVIFGFSGEKLKILITKYHNTGFFALPGGFMQRDENLNDAVRRGLKERTGLENIYLEQFYTFGDVARYKPEIMQTILEANGHNSEPYLWMLDRFISVAYYALINYNDVVPTPDALSDSCDWYDMDKLPNLMLDHAEIVAKALHTLRENLERKLVGTNLLPPLFTLTELQKVYEAILGEKLHRGTFQRKILGLGLLQRHEKQFLGKAHKAPFLYSFGEDGMSL
ncbi:NUDIX domain-containing protein [Arcicella sp. LKC2W]|uniref:NUDIX hydrolase n=1 Tax=Arcicella sp. LKC2W TaxID=2984198 RepID=UPI002B1FF23A|nr:NUDIX domain-containing protein [Arcicella sp. LKC2W]MEA5459474.1 NUDIX domain-containing protein [Arcicella sp. LKC2W]